MIAWKVMLQAAFGGAILGPLAGAAFGPVQMKPPPEQPWRHMLKPDIAASSYDVSIPAPPQDLGPPIWLDGPARRLGWQAVYDPQPFDEAPRLADYRDEEPPAPPEAAPPAEPATKPLGPAPSADETAAVVIHRGGQEQEVAVPIESAPPSVVLEAETLGIS